MTMIIQDPRYSSNGNAGFICNFFQRHKITSFYSHFLHAIYGLDKISFSLSGSIHIFPINLVLISVNYTSLRTELQDIERRQF